MKFFKLKANKSGQVSPDGRMEAGHSHRGISAGKPVGQSGDDDARLLAIRQARDHALAKILTLSEQLRAKEARLVELEQECEDAKLAAEHSATEAAILRGELDTLHTTAKNGAERIEHLKNELNSQREEYVTLSGQKDAALAATSEKASILEEALARIESLAAERDLSQERSAEQGLQFEKLQKEFEDYREETERSFETALNKMHEEMVALEALTVESSNHTNDLHSRLDVLNEQLSLSEKTVENFRAQYESTCAALILAQQDLDAVRNDLRIAHSERDGFRQISQEMEQEAERLGKALLRQEEAHKKVSMKAAERDEELANLRASLNEHNQTVIDLTTGMKDAHGVIRELSANLAEARLRVRLSEPSRLAAMEFPVTPERVPSSLGSAIANDSTTESHVGEQASLDSSSFDSYDADCMGASLVPLPVNSDGPLTEAEARQALAVMLQCFTSFTKKPDNKNPLNKLHYHAQNFADRARANAVFPLSRLCDALAKLTKALSDYSQQIPHASLQILLQSLRIFASMTSEECLSQLSAPPVATTLLLEDGQCS